MRLELLSRTFCFADFAENATKLCQAKQCEHLCLPHAREVQSLPTVSCVCSNGFQLNADQQTCTPAGKLYFYVQ